MNDGNDIVEGSGSGMGGRTKTQGGSHWTCGFWLDQIFESTSTTPEPVSLPPEPVPPPDVPPPSGVSPLPAPESKSTLQTIVPPRQRSLAKASLSLMVSSSS